LAVAAGKGIDLVFELAQDLQTCVQSLAASDRHHFGENVISVVARSYTELYGSGANCLQLSWDFLRHQ